MRMRVLRAAVVAVALGLATTAGAQWSGRSWQSLSPEERQRAWENYQRYRDMPGGRQQMIDRRYQQFQQMPPDQHRSTIEQAHDESPCRFIDPAQRTHIELEWGCTEGQGWSTFLFEAPEVGDAQLAPE